jgi:hypothetical protein
MWKNIEKDTTEIVYDNKNLHITELEDTLPVFILWGVEYDFYFTEYDFCPVWSRVLIFTHCPIKLIYLW